MGTPIQIADAGNTAGTFPSVPLVPSLADFLLAGTSADAGPLADFKTVAASFFADVAEPGKAEPQPASVPAEKSNIVHAGDKRHGETNGDLGDKALTTPAPGFSPLAGPLSATPAAATVPTSTLTSHAEVKLAQPASSLPSEAPATPDSEPRPTPISDQPKPSWPEFAPRPIVGALHAGPGTEADRPKAWFSAPVQENVTGKISRPLPTQPVASPKQFASPTALTDHAKVSRMAYQTHFEDVAVRTAPKEEIASNVTAPTLPMAEAPAARPLTEKPDEQHPSQKNTVAPKLDLSVPRPSVVPAAQASTTLQSNLAESPGPGPQVRPLKNSPEPSPKKEDTKQTPSLDSFATGDATAPQPSTTMPQNAVMTAPIITGPLEHLALRLQSPVEVSRTLGALPVHFQRLDSFATDDATAPQPSTPMPQTTVMTAPIITGPVEHLALRLQSPVEVSRTLGARPVHFQSSGPSAIAPTPAAPALVVSELSTPAMTVAQATPSQLTLAASRTAVSSMKAEPVRGRAESSKTKDRSDDRSDVKEDRTSVADSPEAAHQPAKPGVASSVAATPEHEQTKATIAPGTPSHGKPGPVKTNGESTRSPQGPVLDFDGDDVVTSPAHSLINTAKLIQWMDQSQLRVGIQTREFGNIDIRTSVAPHLFTAEILVEHNDVAKTLTTELPSLYARLADQQVPTAHIQIHSQGLSASAGFDQQSQQQSAATYNYSPSPAGFQTQAVPAAATEAVTAAGRLDIRI